MIAISDAVLIVVSTAVLATGLLRWQNNLEQATLATATTTGTNQVQTQLNPPANTQTGVVRQSSNTNGASASSSTQGSITRNTEQNINTQVVVAEPTQTNAINVADDSATATDNSAVVDVPPYGSYLVQSGDSLSLIALEYGTTVAVLQDINNIEGTLITVGQQLRYPLPVN